MNLSPRISVGILARPVIYFKLQGLYRLAENNQVYEGCYTASLKKDNVLFDGNLYPSLTFLPSDYDAAFFELKDVSIGIQFHWERNENQMFKGNLQFMPEHENLRVINCLLLEDYLESVTASEMNAENPLELLKAHAVVSRSWLLAQLKKRDSIRQDKKKYTSTYISGDEILKWYDREDHLGFDVCADDHCQRYQGISKISVSSVIEAVRETSGEILVSDGEICDARFSKCCGGITEEFENCWEQKHYTYLSSVFCDNKLHTVNSFEDWITTSPSAFCNTNDKIILSRILNDYDRETYDFYRWKVEYSQEEISSLILRKTGVDFGEITDMIALERGRSGRIVRLRIEGTKKQMSVGKELEIRKILSNTHLYSSAFVVEKIQEDNKIPQRFILHGAGWGHGVGLCQIGAAVMASQGYDYKQILNQYFSGIQVEKLY